MTNADLFIRHEAMIKDVTRAIRTGVVIKRLCEEKGYSSNTIANLQKRGLIPYAEPLKAKPKKKKMNELKQQTPE